MSSGLYQQNTNNNQYENQNFFIPNQERMDAFQQFIHRYQSKAIDDYLSIEINIFSF
jgi:hypothetical protein